MKLAAPATRLAMLRLIVGLYGVIYVLARLPHILSYALDDVDRFQPVGVIAFGDAPMLPVVFTVIALCTAGLSIPFFLGYRHRVLAPIYAVGLLVTLTYTNSWGKILHVDNLLVLHVLVLAFSHSADALSLDSRRENARRENRRGKSAPHWRYGWPVALMATVCALAYLLAGVAKLRNSGLDFVDGDTLRNYVAFDNVRKLELGSTYSPLGAALLPYPGLFAGLAWLSFALELSAPVAVLWRRFGKLWAVLVWGFHLGVLALMAIGFLYQLSFVAFAAFFDVERLRRVGFVARVLEKLFGGSEEAAPEIAAAEEAP